MVSAMLLLHKPKPALLAILIRQIPQADRLDQLANFTRASFRVAKRSCRI
jgi:hypothetical protein